MPPSRWFAEARLPSRPRRQFPRSRRGCLTCRQRKKKCDEALPRCSGCTRNELQCRWPEDSSYDAPTTEGKSGSGSRIHSRKTETTRPSAQDDAASAFLVSSSSTTRGWNSTVEPFALSARSTIITPSSSLFLHHYLARTARTMTSAGPGQNPFVTYLVPLAYSDDLIMHCLMALGGAHLEATSQKSSSCFAVSNDTVKHYSCVVHGLRSAFQQLATKDFQGLLRILTVVLLAAQLEAMSSNCLVGGTFVHLNAARELLKLLRGASPSSSADANVLLGMSMEVYNYLTLVNLFGVPGSPHAKKAQADELLGSMASSKKFETFGVLFDNCHELMQILPEITALYGDDNNQGTARERHCQEIRSRIVQWNPMPERTDTCSREDQQWRAVAETWRQSLITYLEAAKTRGQPMSADARRVIQDRIRHVSALALDTGMVDSCHASILMWPTMILGSCLENPGGRRIFVDLARSTTFQTWNSIRGLELLQLLWEDDDELAFGPQGLSYIMQKHGFSYPIG